jgi:hypothetical protein
MVIFRARFSISANLSISSSEGRTLGVDVANLRRGPSTTADCKAMSPGRMSTETPRREIAVCTAISRMRGICSGCDTTLAEQMLRMCFLEIAAPDLAAGNVRRDREDWDSAAMRIVESIDQMKIPRPTASGTGR